MLRRAFILTGAGLALATVVFAGQPQTSEREALTRAEQKFTQAELGAGKPGHAVAARRQRQEVQNLLDQLEAGRKVDPAAVDRLLKEADRP